MAGSCHLIVDDGRHLLGHQTKKQIEKDKKPKASEGVRFILHPPLGTR